MRVTDTMRFNTAISNIFNTQAGYSDIAEKLASQKNINRASDDPVAATKIIEIQREKAANEQYKKNMDSTNSWITATESNLFGAYDLLVKAQEIAVGQATATANETTRKIMAQNVQSLIDEMGKLANAKMGDRYLFSGSRNDVAPFSAVPLDATIETAAAAVHNTFLGTVTSSGNYSGDVNNTYAVKITKEGALGVAEYQFSADGGKTWNTVSDIANTESGLSITVDTLIMDIDGYGGYAADDYIHLEGTDSDNNPVSDDTLVLTGTTTIGDLLAKIQDVFGDVTASMTSDGKLMINTPAASPVAVKISVKDFGGADDGTLNFATGGNLTMTVPAVGGIDLGEDVTLTFGAGVFGMNDIFYVNAIAPGYYRGNDGNLSMPISRGISVDYNIKGSDTFTAAGSNNVDVLKTLNDLKDALNSSDVPGILTQLGNLKNAQSQITLNQSLCGAKANYIEVAKNNLTELDMQLTSLLAQTQDADLADLAIKLSMKDIALQASYAMASKIGTTTILNFLK